MICMTARSLALLVSATVTLWVVPSVGTQGMGTIGARVTHPDAVLVDTAPADRMAASALLAHADRVAETALGL